jgi:phosphatidylglycerophosphatase A
VDPEDHLVSFVGAELLVIIVVTLVGIWAASRVERVLRIKDPGRVVVDEVAGQLIALLPVPLMSPGWPYWLIPAFALFRFFDIVKPYPARKLESLHGGLGIMLDDVVAGVYAAIVVALAVVASWYI